MLPIWAGEQNNICLNQTILIGGSRNIHETTLHINCKELLAAWLGLQCYASITLQDVYIHVWIDNTAAVAYVNRMGGLHSFQEPVSTSLTGLGLHGVSPGTL